MIPAMILQEPLKDPSDGPHADLGAPFAPIPSLSSLQVIKSTSHLTPVICDERAISTLLEVLLSRSGVSISEIARRMGCTTQVIRQYLHGRRSKPSLLWFVRLASLCGAEVVIKFPQKGLK